MSQDELFPQDASQPAASQPSEPSQPAEPHPLDNIISVQLRKKYGSLFPGEIGGFPSHIADGLIKTGGAYPLDESGQAIIPASEEKRLPDLPRSNIIEPDDDGGNDAGQPSRRPRGRKKAEQASSTESTSESGGKPSLVADELIKPFLADGIQRDEASALYNAGLETPEDVTHALSIGRDLEKEIKGIGPKTFADLKTLYGE